MDLKKYIKKRLLKRDILKNKLKTIIKKKE